MLFMTKWSILLLALKSFIICETIFSFLPIVFSFTFLWALIFFSVESEDIYLLFTYLEPNIDWIVLNPEKPTYFHPPLYKIWAKDSLLLFSFAPISIQWSTKLNYKSAEGVLGMGTQLRRMEGADESTELWRLPQPFISF